MISSRYSDYVNLKFIFREILSHIIRIGQIVGNYGLKERSYYAHVMYTILTIAIGPYRDLENGFL